MNGDTTPEWLLLILAAIAWAIYLTQSAVIRRRNKRR